MPQPCVVVDVKLTRLAFTHDHLDLAWADLGPRRLRARPVHVLLSNPTMAVIGHRRPPALPASVLDAAADLVAALAAAPLAAFDPDLAADGIERLLAFARRPSALPAVVDIGRLVADRVGATAPLTLDGACAVLRVRPPHPVTPGSGRVAAAVSCLTALDRFDTDLPPAAVGGAGLPVSA